MTRMKMQMFERNHVLLDGQRQPRDWMIGNVYALASTSTRSFAPLNNGRGMELEALLVVYV